MGAASVGFEPGLQRTLAFQAEGQVQPGLPVAQRRAPEFDMEPAGEALWPQRVDATQLAAQAHMLAERGRQPRLEREARRACAPVEANLHLLELEQRRAARLVSPGQARAADEDLALREQPAEAAVAGLLPRRELDPGDVQRSRRITPYRQVGRTDLEAVKVRLEHRQRGPRQGGVHLRQGQHRAALRIGQAHPGQAQARPPARPASVDALDRHRHAKALAEQLGERRTELAHRRQHEMAQRQHPEREHAPDDQQRVEQAAERTPPAPARDGRAGGGPGDGFDRCGRGGGAQSDTRKTLRTSAVAALPARGAGR